MKCILLSLFIICIFGEARAQKKVDAVINLVNGHRDTLSIPKGKSFVVQLSVHNRYGDDWAIGTSPLKCKFIQSMIGQAGMFPNQPETKLIFFKAVEKGWDSIRFVYKNPKSEPGSPQEEKVLIVNIQ